jgi:hypothetical protein
MLSFFHLLCWWLHISICCLLPGIVNALNNSLVTVNIAVSHVPLDLGLPSLNTLKNHQRFSFDNMLNSCDNALINVAIICC